jgi:hypothetical protein
MRGKRKPDLACRPRLTILEQDRAARNSGAFFYFIPRRAEMQHECTSGKIFTKFFPEGRQDAIRPCAILPGRHLPPTHGN